LVSDVASPQNSLKTSDSKFSGNFFHFKILQGFLFIKLRNLLTVM